MLTEVMRYYHLARPPVDAGFYETEHHAQVSRDIRAAIMGGRLIALTAVIGSGKTILSRRLRADLEREGRVIVSRSLSVESRSRRSRSCAASSSWPMVCPAMTRSADCSASSTRHSSVSRFSGSWRAFPSRLKVSWRLMARSCAAHSTGPAVSLRCTW